VIGWKNSGVCTRNRLGSYEVDARGSPGRSLKKRAVEANLSVFVLAVVSHVVDGGVFGEAFIVWS
jgi:hypothetical protein